MHYLYMINNIPKQSMGVIFLLYLSLNMLCIINVGEFDVQFPYMVVPAIQYNRLSNDNTIV